MPCFQGSGLVRELGLTCRKGPEYGAVEDAEEDVEETEQKATIADSKCYCGHLPTRQDRSTFNAARVAREST